MKLFGVGLMLEVRLHQFIEYFVVQRLLGFVVHGGCGGSEIVRYIY
jgi:hypothetical protein